MSRYYSYWSITGLSSEIFHEMEGAAPPTFSRGKSRLESRGRGVLARIMHEAPQRDRGDGRAAGQPQGLGPEAYLSVRRKVRDPRTPGRTAISAVAAGGSWIMRARGGFPPYACSGRTPETHGGLQGARIFWENSTLHQRMVLVGIARIGRPTGPSSSPALPSPSPPGAESPSSTSRRPA